MIDSGRMKNMSDDRHRIMHQEMGERCANAGLKVLFHQCGNMDETDDRNNNGGIIDSIDGIRLI